MLLINENETFVLGLEDKPVENKIAWRSRSEGKLIIAVGGPSDWSSQEPLPPEAVLTDLVCASLETPKLAEELWSYFLAYVDRKENRGFIHGFKNSFFGIPVKVDIADVTTFRAVARAVTRSKRYRIRLKAG